MRPQSQRPPLRHFLRDILKPYGSGPHSSRLNLYVDLFILAAIITSCLLVPLEHFHSKHERTYWRIEIGFAVFFVVEYLARWYASESRWRYPFTFLALIDLLAIVPTLLLLSDQSMMLRLVRGIRILRLLRLIRLLRLMRYGFLIHRALLSLRIRYSALSHTYRIEHLGRLFGWLFIAWIIGANIIYFTEAAFVAPTTGRGGAFSNYWISYWHATIALVSGIEDKEPHSLLGRIEMTALLLTGICVVGMFTGEIVSILVKKAQRLGKLAIKPPRAHFERHILILGANAQLDNVIRQVSAAASRHRPHVVVVTPEAEELRVTDTHLYRKVFAINGDPTDARVLEQANIGHASRVIVLSMGMGEASADQIDSYALMQALAVVARRRNKPVPLVVELQSEESLDFAAPLSGVDLLVGRHYGEKLISQAVLNPGVTELYVELLTFTDESNELYVVDVPPLLVGMTFLEAQLHFLDYEDEDIVLLGIDRSPPNLPSTRFWLNPAAGSSEAGEASTLSAKELQLDSDDRLVLIACERPAFANISQEDKWSGKILDRS